ncbi:MAG: hypothetical protein VB861_02630, partial [Planctomycetaceae bacterium]
KGGDLDYGARPLRRSVESCIEDPLSEEILRGAFEGQNRIDVTVTEVGDQKQLNFEGSTVAVETDDETADEAEAESEADEDLAAVTSGDSKDDSADSADSDDSSDAAEEDADE